MSSKSNYCERRILVVDDEEFMRSLVKRVLMQMGVAHILSAEDGSSAVRTMAAETLPVDCILCDFNMEPVNGLQLLKAIRSGKAKGIPRDQKFIMLTGHADKDIISIALKLGVNGYVVKPVPADKLSLALDRAFDSTTTLASEQDYMAVSLGDAEKVRVDDKARSSPSVMWNLKRTQDNGLEEKLKAIREAGKSNSADAGLTFKNVSTCWVKDLEADMILAEDVQANGVILITAGTEMTDNLVEKLKAIVEDSDSVPYVKIGEIA